MSVRRPLKTALAGLGVLALLAGTCCALPLLLGLAGTALAARTGNAVPVALGGAVVVALLIRQRSLRCRAGEAACASSASDERHWFGPAALVCALAGLALLGWWFDLPPWC